MKKFSVFLISALLFFGGMSDGVQIVYPGKTNITINSDKTFFVGNENRDKILKINDEVVSLHPSGGFKHVVKLNYGQNIFVIDNGGEKQTYVINRPQPKNVLQSYVCAKTDYDKPIVISLVRENTPLRSTPVDAGLNRLQHLPVGIEFLAIGEERGFYRVKLGRDGFGFIAKDSAVKVDKDNIEFANVCYNIHNRNEKEKFVEISLNNKVPYTVTDNSSGLDIVVYDVDYPFNYLQEHIEGKPFGYSSYYNDDGVLVVSMKEFPKVNSANPLENIKISIDAGHGGTETGAMGCLGTKEKDVNLEIANNLKNKLVSLGANVFMTREDDYYVGLNERVEKSNYFDADIFLSIHNNSLPDSLADKDASGTETYYFYPQSKELAKILAESISQKTGFKNNGAKGQSFAVVRNTQSIAVLIEVGYMINPDDNYKIITKEYQDKITDGIIDGLERYLRNGI